ncbi:MAG: FAD-dependent oxidoreductase [Thermoleophilia bacterium]|nr:FAD-dependent oxidoreductase [Thermoleophilia bacterium]
MAPMTFNGALLEKIPRTADTTSYRFSRPPEYGFEAGQYFLMTIPSPAGRLTHAFSHCDSPGEKHVELTTRLTGSDYKKALDELPIGAEVEIDGPYGEFVFRYETPKIAFLTGGVGITPIRSMLRCLADTGGAGRIEGQELVLVYGSMTANGILYQEELDEFARTIPGLRVVHVITNPTEDWKGYSGFISADILRAELGDPSPWTYYIVGPPPMITAMQKLMEQLEVPTTQRVVENFAGYAT